MGISRHLSAVPSKLLSLAAFVFTAAFANAQQAIPYPATTQHPGPAWFVDVAAKAGVTVRNVNGGDATKQYILESTGSGVAIVDYDRDGWPDIFLVNGQPLQPTSGGSTTPPTKSHLLHNNHDGTFTDVTEKMGIDVSGWGQGACVGDYDNDGFDDLFVTAYGRNHLLHNDAGKHFTDVGVNSGAAGSGTEWSTGCAFVDYDRDGKLDLAIATYVHFNLAKTPKPGAEAGCMWKGAPVMCGPRGLPYAPNMLLHNRGGGHFEDVSASSGIAKTSGHYCFSVTTLDYNDDGWPDLFMACDSTPSILYRNNHDGTFSDVAAEAGVAYNEDGREQAGMGSTAADYDGDGHVDLFKTNFSDDTGTLYHANGDGTFTDITSVAGLAVNSDALGWGTMFADVNNDGFPDLLVVNGHVYPEVDQAQLGATFREPRFLYLNQRDGRFKDISKTSGPGLSEPLSGRGLATADLWNDGRIEAVVNNLSDRPMLLVNEAANGNHWVGLQLEGTTSNRSAIGARVTLSGTDSGKARVWVDEVRSGSSFDSSSDLRLHFGIGSHAKVEKVMVRWSNGVSEQFPVPAPDHYTTLREGLGRPRSTPVGESLNQPLRLLPGRRGSWRWYQGPRIFRTQECR